MVLFDSDLLFFDEPTDIYAVWKTATIGSTRSMRIAKAPTRSMRSGADAAWVRFARVNSGFGLIHRDSMRWDWIEEFLALPGLVDGHFWRIEQTLYALCSSRYGAELLPEEYAVRLEPGIQARPFRHYVGAIRHLMYGEGIARLVKGGFLRAHCCI